MAHEMTSIHCTQCGEIVGVYEPALLLLRDGTEQRGSPLTLGDQLLVPGAVMMHERCYIAFIRGVGKEQAEAHR